MDNNIQPIISLTVEVEQSSFPVEIEKNNLSINLSKMGEPFGQNKRPSSWLRTKEAQQYIAILSDAQICASADLVGIRKGGEPKWQGTWCHDYRIALQYAKWLDVRFSIFIDDAIVKLINGQGVFNKSIKINGEEYISIDDYCNYFKRNRNSFYGLMSHYRTQFERIENGLYISIELFNMQDIKVRFEQKKQTIKQVDQDKKQLSLEFKD